MPFSFWLKTQTSNFKLFLSTEGTEDTEKKCFNPSVFSVDSNLIKEQSAPRSLWGESQN